MTDRPAESEPAGAPDENTFSTCGISPSQQTRYDTILRVQVDARREAMEYLSMPARLLDQPREEL